MTLLEPIPAQAHCQTWSGTAAQATTTGSWAGTAHPRVCRAQRISMCTGAMLLLHHRWFLECVCVCVCACTNHSSAGRRQEIAGLHHDRLERGQFSGRVTRLGRSQVDEWRSLHDRRRVHVLLARGERTTVGKRACGANQQTIGANLTRILSNVCTSTRVFPISRNDWKTSVLRYAYVRMGFRIVEKYS